MTSVRGGYGFQLKTPNNPLERVGLRVLDPGPDEVVVEVAGCGVCHTDVAFATDGVPTRHPLPLILGHEISPYFWPNGKMPIRGVGRPLSQVPGRCLSV